MDVNGEARPYMACQRLCIPAGAAIWGFNNSDARINHMVHGEVGDIQFQLYGKSQYFEQICETSFEFRRTTNWMTVASMLAVNGVPPTMDAVEDLRHLLIGYRARSSDGGISLMVIHGDMSSGVEQWECDSLAEGVVYMPDDGNHLVLAFHYHHSEHKMTMGIYRFCDRSEAN